MKANVHNGIGHKLQIQRRAERLLKRHRAHTEPYLQEFSGMIFEMLLDVFNPAYGEGAALLVDFLDVQEGERVLDVGTGSGAVAIHAAEKAGRVVATDISPLAVECARRNVVGMRVGDKVEVRQGDVFEPLRPEERFSLIIFNPPFMRGVPSDWLEVAMYDDGYATLASFLAGLNQRLTEDGRALVVFSTVGEVDYFYQQIEKHGLHSELLKESLDNEMAFLLYQLRIVPNTVGDI